MDFLIFLDNSSLNIKLKWIHSIYMCICIKVLQQDIRQNKQINIASLFSFKTILTSNFVAKQQMKETNTFISNGYENCRSWFSYTNTYNTILPMSNKTHPR